MTYAGCTLWVVQLINTLNTDNKIDPINAGRNPATVNPGTMYAASINNKAFIINVNNPRVMRLRGRVRNRIIGLMNKFINPITAAATRADPIPPNDIPGTIQATISSAIASSIHLTIKFNIFLSPAFLNVYCLSIKIF